VASLRGIPHEADEPPERIADREDGEAGRRADES
jgi:hypothetical protein